MAANASHLNLYMYNDNSNKQEAKSSVPGAKIARAAAKTGHVKITKTCKDPLPEILATSPLLLSRWAIFAMPRV